MRIRLHHLTVGGALLCAAAASLPAQTYHVTKSFTLGGDGGWDYVALDTAGHRLFVARQTRVMVIDPATGKLLAEIPGLDRAHGVAFSYATGKGFATSGGDSSVVVFDLKTLQVLGRTTAAVDADAVLFDPATKHVFTFNGDAGSSSVIDAASGQRIGTIDLGGKPEFGVTAGNGRLYVNIEDSSAVAEIDATAMKVVRHWKLAPCESPTGLAIDRAHGILFSACRNGVMAISDAKAGRLITTLPIGQGVDGARFDDQRQLAFASNGDGTITVIHEDAPDKFTVVATVQTKRGARTMELDQQTHRLFTVSADFGPPPAPTADRPRPRPPVLPGTFVLLELDP
ncbi:MAG TPA: YncE family protein [Gemmatimonadales bacterium]|nr:YncE family protein [Gemmatimonadales bacterium]